jgi:hypothetical protein
VKYRPYLESGALREMLLHLMNGNLAAEAAAYCSARPNQVIYASARMNLRHINVRICRNEGVAYAH